MAIRPIDMPLMSNRSVEMSREAGRFNKSHELFQNHLSVKAHQAEAENLSKVQTAQNVQESAIHKDGKGNGSSYERQETGRRKRKKIRDLMQDGESAGFGENSLDIRV